METDIKSSDGALEEPKDAGKGEEGEIKRWMMEIDLAAKTERDWHHNAKRAIERYRNDRKVDDSGKEKDDHQYNIFWSNVEVLRPALYGATPQADVRRRFRDPDPVGKIVAEIMERALDFSIDTSDFDGVMNNIILDYLIPSRAVARVRFDPTVEESEGQPVNLTFAKTYIERVPWDRFKRGPGITWDEVPWIAYEHQLTKDELRVKFPGKSALVDYDVTMDGVSDEKAATEPNVFKRVRLYEIWDKQNAEILWLAPSCKTEFLLREPDKLKLEGFFDCEKPLYAIETGTTLVPLVEYDMYRSQAKELDKVTVRINRLISSLRQRGIYDSTIKEFGDLFSATDNEMIPTASAIAAMQAGGLEKAIWLMPIETAAAVLKQLYTQRDQVKQTIYELTGISDILRGSSDPNETLGAQQLKAQTGSMRLQRRQRDVQRFIRGLIRKMGEIIAQNYTPEILSQMTGIKLPTAEEKAMAQQTLQSPLPGQPPAPPPSPAVMDAANSPSWEEVMPIIRSDLLRSFRVDIETDSTIAPDQASERQQVTELIEGIGGFVKDIGPAVEQGAITMEAAKKILESCLRRFKLGREVEDVIEHDNNQPSPQKPDPAQVQAQAEQAKVQGLIQLEQTKAQIAAGLEDKKHQNNLQLETFKQQNAIQLEQAKAQIQAQQDQTRAVADAHLAGAQQQAQGQQDLVSQNAEAERKRQEMQLQHESDTKKMLLDHKMDIEQIHAASEARLKEIVAKMHADLLLHQQEAAAKIHAEAIDRQESHQNDMAKIESQKGIDND